jgi:hypothetical protein
MKRLLTLAVSVGIIGLTLTVTAPFDVRVRAQNRMNYSLV